MSKFASFTGPPSTFLSVQTIVIGHKNPDMDSICSALAYARLKAELGWKETAAARAGNLNARIS